MGLNQFRNTISVIRRNPYANFYKATLKHILWQFRKICNLFPCVLEVEHFEIIIKNKIIANGCGGLINCMGLYDPNNMRLIDELCRTGVVNCFFDIGANIGIYSLIPESSIQVYAFEPHPYTYTLLNENVVLNNRVNIHTIQQALDNKEGLIHFSDLPGSTINQIIRENNNGNNVITVSTIKGDDFCKNNAVKPSLLKIDTEGNEERVLHGFEATLKFIKMILVETEDIDIITLLLKENDFIGPYKFDHINRTFSLEYESYEDWIFINRKHIREFNNFTISNERHS